MGASFWQFRQEREHNVAFISGTFLSIDVPLVPKRELMHEFFDRTIMFSASYISCSHEYDITDGDDDNDDDEGYSRDVKLFAVDLSIDCMKQ